MAQPATLTTAQLDVYLNRINTGGVTEVVKVYQELYDQGYNYAGWAKGVATAETVTGVAAIDYLTGTALAGLGGEECRNLSETQIDAIRAGMARGYVSTLREIARNNNNLVNTDVDFEQTQEFHQRELERNGLSIKNWTLQTPMELIRQTEGDAAVEAYWVRLRETGGDGPDALLESLWLYTKIGKLANGSDPAIAAQANDWIAQVPGTANFDAIGRAADDLYTVLIENNPWLYLIPNIGPILLAITLIRNADDLQQLPFDILDTFKFGYQNQTIFNTLITDWNIAKNTVSPLILDLDGDGVVETQAKATGIYFDHAGDGFAESTGWAASDDGLLVRDLNGDGVINNGGELFGNNTRLNNGQKAENGFEALADLDSNKDGKLNSADTAWNTLRVWKDTDSDAQTDTGELLTLAEAGVKEFKLAYTDTSGNPDQHGNEHKQSGSYTTTAGTTRAAHDVWFGTDNWNTIDQRTPIELSSTVAAMPEVIGSGMLGSLRQAMMRDASGQLIAAVNAYLSVSTDQRDTLLQDVLYHWAGVHGQDPTLRGPYLEDGRKLAVLEAFFGEQYVQLGGGQTGPTINDPGPDASAELIRLFDNVAVRLGAQIDAQGRDAPFYNAISLNWNESTQAFSIDASGVETYVRELFSQQPKQALEKLAQFVLNLHVLGTTEVLKALAASGNLQGDDIDQLLAHANGIWGTTGDDQIWDDSAQDSFLFGWKGNDTLYGDSGNDTLDGGAGNDTLNGGAGNDTYLFGKGSGTDTVLSYDNTTVGKLDVIQLGTGIATTDVTIRREGDTLVLTINGTSDSLRVSGFFGNDATSHYRIEQIKFADGTIWDVNIIKAMVIKGTDGNDTLIGYATDDILSGGAGHDTLNGGAGNDTLDGGADKDVLNGGTGNNTYLFGRGDGQDNIARMLDTTEGKSNTLRFKEGVLPSDIVIKQTYSLSLGWIDAELSIAGTADKITITDFWLEDGNYKVVQRIEFADGTVWTAADVNAVLFAGTAGDDVIGGSKAGDSITGQAGADQLSGNDGNDTLDGGAGNDKLDGEDGDDTLQGGYGDDQLQGSNGSDTFVYLKGDGRDTISRIRNESNDTETLKLIDLQPSQVKFFKQNSDLLIQVSPSSSDVIRIKGHFNAFGTGQHYLDQIEFADGSVMNSSTFSTMATAYVNKLNTIKGTSASKPVKGSKLNDAIYAGAGDDKLTGGIGDDLLIGQAGNDAYVFRKGHGRDTIDVVKGTKNGFAEFETLQLTDISSSDVVLTRNKNDLFVAFSSSPNDQIRVINHFQKTDKGAAAIDSIVFADGTTWNADTIREKVITPTAGNDQLQGYVTGDLMHGGDGDDQLYGNAGDDFLYGDNGNDQLNGGIGDDTLQGGLGNDVLDGGRGNDTFVFGKGDGRDTIFVAAFNDNNANETLVLRDINSTEVNLIQYDGSLYVQQKGSTADHVKIVGHFDGGSNALDKLIFADGLTWDAATINANSMETAQNPEYV
jgi:Ca2+-binding RTX toxin-like protein